MTLKLTIVAPVLLCVLLVVAMGCGSDSDDGTPPPVATAEAPVATPTAHPDATGAADRLGTAAPTADARKAGGSGQSSPPDPTVAPTNPSTRVRGTTPTPTALPAPTPTPDVVRVSESSAERESSPSVSEGDIEALVAGNSAFAFDLYHAIADGEGNLLFSPHSVSVALAMAYAGASGETERQMSDTLRFELPQVEIHPAFNALDLSLRPSNTAEDESDFRLNVANSIWGQQGHGFLPEFLDTLAVNYGDGVRPVDFHGDSESARAMINDWVSDATEERITDLIPQDAIDQYTRLVLANAIYFKARWQHTFDAGATTPGDFHLLDGSRTEVSMMRQQADLRYASGVGYQAVELPYLGGEVAMTILLPDLGRFREFDESVSGESVDAILAALDHKLVRLTMPRFEVEPALNFSDTLAAMGMPDAFDETAADFSGMDGRRCQARGDICLLITDVLHKAFVSVDEAGTEAAAATAVIVGTTRAVQEPEPIVLVVDRPFLFVIRHQETGAVMFVGRVLSP